MARSTAAFPPVNKGFIRRDEELIEALPDLVPGYPLPSGAVVVSSGDDGDYASLAEAMAAITDATAENRRVIVVRGTITETAPVTAKNYVDVLFLDGAILNCNSTTSAAKGIVFTNITDARWRAHGSAEIRRTGTAGERNYVVDMTGSGVGRIYFDNLIFRNLTHGTARNYGVQIGNVNVTARNCEFHGAGTDRPYGIVADGTSFFYDCKAYGGDCTIGGAGGNTAQGWLITQTSTARVTCIRCVGYGGNCGTGNEAYGFWVFAYSGQGADQSFCYMQDCIGYGGIAANYTDGINCHKSATAHLVRCTGISGANGNGITIVGQLDNFARFVLDDCVGISRSTIEAAVNRHGLGIYEACRDRVNGGTFVGSPFITNSAGVYVNQQFALGGGAAADLTRLEVHGARFYGGGAGMEAQGETTQQTGCPGAWVVETEIGARFVGCSFIGNELSPGIQIDATANPANLFLWRGAAYSTDPATNVAINSVSAWGSASVHEMILEGGVTNVTPAAGTAIGTNINP